jgi:hypothetical protein
MSTHVSPSAEGSKPVLQSHFVLGIYLKFRAVSHLVQATNAGFT